MHKSLITVDIDQLQCATIHKFSQKCISVYAAIRNLQASAGSNVPSRQMSMTKNMNNEMTYLRRMYCTIVATGQAVPRGLLYRAT